MSYPIFQFGLVYPIELPWRIDQMKPVFCTKQRGILFSLALLSSFSLPMQAFDANPLISPGTRYVEVTGTGTVYALPDEAVIALGVRSWNKDIRASYAENERVLKQILGVIAKHKIPAKNIQTSEISVEPTFAPGKYDSGTKPEGYKVSKRITVVVKDFPSVPALLADAIESGANRMDSLDFRITNPRKWKDEARVLAINAAKEKAQAMATQLSSQLGKILVIREVGSTIAGLQDRYSYFQSSNNNISRATPMMVEGADESATGDFATGQKRVTSVVSATFEITD